MQDNDKSLWDIHVLAPREIHRTGKHHHSHGSNECVFDVVLAGMNKDYGGDIHAEGPGSGRKIGQPCEGEKATAQKAEKAS